MLYKRIKPDVSLQDLIDCFWIVENDDPAIHRQKIIPDGFPEIIFHYGDPYRINISGKWELQTSRLMAGQIRNHFMLENTGISGMIGIKFQPAAIAQLFNLDMETFTDKVVDLDSCLKGKFEPIADVLISDQMYPEKVSLLIRFFTSIPNRESKNDRLVNRAVDIILDQKGMVTISDIIKKMGISERHMERLFKKYVGLSPKFYSRIIRFSYIFQLVHNEKMSWSEVAQYSGFYDQSHFIKNFREFTGEDPSNYFFDDNNMANFFLNRP